MTTYAEKLKDPRWQKKRLEILERDNWTCQYCGNKDTTLHVHHREYRDNLEPWEYPNIDLITLCELCHKKESLRKPFEDELIKQLRKDVSFDNLVYFICTSGIMFITKQEDYEPLLEKIYLLSNKYMDWVIQRDLRGITDGNPLDQLSLE